MKIIQVNIYGFGKWIDRVIDFSNTQPLCLYGENESGKSTLQQFMLYVLFGLPPRKLKLFRPIYSNKIGGRVTVEDQSVGRYQIERVEQEVICHLPNGELQDEAWLQERLQGINRDVYTSIYAFSAMDLMEIRQMKKAHLSNVLFSVGLSGSTNIYEAEKLLETKTGQLFKKQGRNPLINKQINIVKEGHKTLINRQKKEAAYQDKQIEIKQLIDEKEQNMKAEERCKSTLLKTEKTIHVLPQLQEYQRYQEEIEAEQPAGVFPENGVERLEYWQEKLHPLQGELRVAKMQLQKDKRATDEIEKTLHGQNTIDSAKAIMEQRATYEYLLQQEKGLSAQTTQIQDKVKMELATVQIEEKSLQQFDFPFHLEKDWRELQQTHEQLLQKEESQTEHYNTLLSKEAEIEKVRMENEHQQMMEPEIDQVKNAYHQAGAITHQNEQKNRWQQWERRRMKTAKVVLISASILAVLSILIALFTDNAILLALPVVILLAGVLQYMNMRNTIAFILQESMANEAQAVHTKGETNTPLLVEQQRIKTALQQIEEQAQQLAVEKRQWKEEQATFLKKENMWVQLVEKERQRYPFLQHVEIEYWLDLLSKLRKILHLQWDKEQQEKELVQIRADLEAINQERKVVSQQLLDQKGLLTFEQIQNMMDEQHSQQHFLDQYRKQMDHRAETIQVLKEKNIVYDEEIEKLFNYANVSDEETYLQRAAILRRQKTIQEEMAKLKQSLGQLLGPKEMEGLLQQSMVENELTLQLQTLEEELIWIQEQQAELNKALATIEMEVNQLELSEEHSTAIYQQQMEQDTLQQMGQRWASLKVAQAALAAAKTAYQKHHFDEVLQQTSSFFQTITDGAYKKVIAPSEKDVFQVEGEHQIRYTIDTLSQGTIDQLYVSLRLAIGIVMSKTHHMPFMMDDAFVHFDSSRLKKMIHILKSVQNEQQIIIFTCRADIAEAFDHVHTLS